VGSYTSGLGVDIYANVMSADYTAGVAGAMGLFAGANWCVHARKHQQRLRLDLVG
jgi:hypothetical protein